MTKRDLFGIVLLILFSHTGIYGQRELRKIQVSEIGMKLETTLIPVNSKMSCEGIDITLNPVSPDQLNEYFNSNSSNHGRLKYEFYDKSRERYFIKRKRKRTKSDMEFILDGVKWMHDNGYTTKQTHEDLIEDIVNHYMDIEIPEDYFDQRETVSNPYIFNKTYMSVFEISFENNTSDFKVFDDAILIEYENQLQTPLTSTEVSTRLTYSQVTNPERINILQKFNLELPVIIPPNSKITKYFSFIPFNYNNGKLFVSMPSAENKFEWDVNTTKESINESYDFYELPISWSFGPNPAYGSDYIIFPIMTTDSKNIYMSNDSFYIGENSLDEDFHVLWIGRMENKLYYSVGTYQARTYIDVIKKRTRYIPLGSNKINEVKQKVKL